MRGREPRPRTARTSRLVDLGWLTFHILGGVACHVWGVWWWYWGAFAVVEVVGLWVESPMTWTVRDWLREGGRWRRAVTLAWCLWFSSAFGMYATALPMGVRGVIVLGFYIWVTRHFLESLRRP